MVETGGYANCVWTLEAALVVIFCNIIVLVIFLLYDRWYTKKHVGKIDE